MVKSVSNATSSKHTTKITLKRKVGYVHEEVSVARTRFEQMELTVNGEKAEVEGLMTSPE